LWALTFAHCGNFTAPLTSGEPEAVAASVGVAGVVNAIERLEEFGKGFFRDTRTIVADGDGNKVVRSGDHYLDATAVSRIEDGITQNILKGAAQHVLLARAMVTLGPILVIGNLYVGLAGLEAGVLDGLSDDLIEGERLGGGPEVVRFRGEPR
jgi:hypothetical protein